MSRWRRWLPYVLLAVALVAVLYLTDQNRRLTARYVELQQLARRPYVGYAVPALRVESASGDSLVVGEAAAGHRQVVFYLDASCPHCLASLPAWREIDRRLEKEERVGVLALAIDSPEAVKSYAERHRLPFRVAAFPSRREALLYRAGTVPVTTVLDHRGQVLFVRTGRMETGPAVDSVVHAALNGLPSGEIGTVSDLPDLIRAAGSHPGRNLLTPHLGR